TARIDGSLSRGRAVVDLDAQSPGVGTVRAMLDVTAPRDLADPDAWMRLPRARIRSAEVTVAGLDLARAAALAGTTAPATGAIDEGPLALWRRGLARASVTVRGTIAPTPVRTLLATFGRPDALVGTVDGSIALGGTLGAPTGEAELVLANAGLHAPTLRDLT